MANGLSSLIVWERLSSGSRALRACMSVGVCVAILCGSAGVSPAQDLATARTDVAGSPDFRIRVTAALVLGRAHAPDSRALLEHALADSHPAVRAAAAAALGALGDSAAVPALQRRLAAESSGSVQSQMRTTITALTPVVAVAAVARSGPSSARYVVQLGNMKNNTTVRGDQLGTVMRAAAKSRAEQLPGVVVQDGSDESVLRGATGKRIPVLLLDGTLTRLAQGSSNGNVMIQAQVEFSVRRVPEQTLQGTLSGAATSVDSAKVLRSEARVSEMQDQAVDGAVESAMRGASSGLAMAAK